MASNRRCRKPSSSQCPINAGYQSGNSNGENDFHTPLDTPLAKKNCSQPSESKDVVIASALIDKYCFVVPNKMGTESSVSVHVRERSLSIVTMVGRTIRNWEMG